MRAPVGFAMVLIVAAAGFHAFSPRTAVTPPAIATPVGNMQLTSVQQTSAGLVVAGELGHILLSTDQGQSWQPAQRSVNRQALITRLSFASADEGLALGHEGWILRTRDGGRTWTEVNFDASNGEPLMDAARLPSGDWLVVGAFGRVLRSTDGGDSWAEEVIDGLTDWHLNTIVSSADAGKWLIVGEAGTLLRSLDGAQSWEVVEPFYNGSLYGALHLGGSTWVSYGMRGHVFHSEDDGATWQEARLPAPISVYSHALTADGTLLLVGQGDRKSVV